MEFLHAQFMTTDLPNSQLFRECVAMDLRCEESAQFSWDNKFNPVGFRHMPPALHWSRCREYPWALGVVPISPTDRILDAGGGHGPLQYLLAQRGAHVTNADRSQESLEIIGRHPLRDTVTQDWQDLTRLTYPAATFDKIYCISVLEHVDDQCAAARELVRVLKPGGYLILTCDVPLRWTGERPTAETLQFDPRFGAMLNALGAPPVGFHVRDMAIGTVGAEHLGIFMAVLRQS